MVLQGVKSNYETDLFTPLIDEIEALTSFDYGQSNTTDIAMRVISDHIRAVAFSIADGKLPSNNGSGYVIRRILRRAVRYGFSFLDQKKPFIYRLVSTLIDKLGDNFDELNIQKQLIENVIKEEEQSFLRTLDQGLLLLDQIVKSSKSKIISGKKAFELYDTYGFPIDLTSIILDEKGISVDIDEFNLELEKQKNRSKAASESKTDDWIVLIDDPIQEFVGYDLLTAKVKITKYREVNSAKQGKEFHLVFNLTPFYAEGGGQVGDKGYLELSNGDVIYITDTRRENNIIIHSVKDLPKILDDSFTAVVDKNQRNRTSSNHTATHLLHQALREVLGTHVEQKGSAVHSKYLRFDFSHFEKISLNQLNEIESYVNSRIKDDLLLEENRQVQIENALDNGAIALFGEKYDDVVRTIKFGNSIELCGGTHVKSTSNIWQFKIKSEGAIASGIRRIEAITSDGVKDYFNDINDQYIKIKSILNNTKDPVSVLTDLKNENLKLKKELDQLLSDKLSRVSISLQNEIKQINGVNFLVKQLDFDISGLKNLAFSLSKKFKNLYLLFIAKNNSKVNMICFISKDLVELHGLDARKEIKTFSALVNGGGGGQDFMATAGGSKIEGINEVLELASKRFN